MLVRADKTQAYRILRAQESKIIDRYRITDGAKFRLKDYDPADTAGHQSDKPLARALLEGGVLRLSEQQEKLYAQDRWAMLCCFQAMDAAGKDGTHQARDIGREPARRAGDIVQGAGS